MSISPDHSGCVTAGNDGEMRVWSLDLKGLYERATQVTTVPDKNFLAAQGTLHRQSKDRAVGIYFHPRRDYFAVHGSDKAVEIWRIRSEAEVQKSLARKRRRRREKEASKAQDGPAGAEKPTSEADDPTAAITPDITDVFVLHAIVRTGGRVRSVDWAGRYSRKDLQILVAATNNMLEYYRVADTSGQAKAKQDESPDYSRLFAVDMPGHRTDIRSLSLSNDNKMLASASNGSLKVWNVQSGSCIRTFECGYALCCSFLPGDRIIVVGNKGGELELYDVASATSINSVKGHDGAIWTLRVHPDGRSMVSGSADKTVKFWKFEITQEEVAGQTSPRLSLVHTRTLKGSDDILSVCFSPDGRLLALGLLDNTVKVFFVDSLKLYLNLYGHKLPVLSMDISHDSRLIVTCSADKNIRLWGLDFGDCHKAFFAHQDSIMQVAFVPHNRAGTGHHFFSASKDRLLKYWDGDKFEQIQKLDGHHGEIWALAVSRTGEFVVTASHDRSMRVWEETDEPLFLEEEREKELEELYESTLTASLERDGGGGDDDDDKAKAEVAAAGKQTVETLVTGERIIEALEAGMADLELMREWEAAAAARAPHEPRMAPPARNPLFTALGGISADEHVLAVLQKVRAAALHDALLILPFSLLPALLTFLDRFAAAQRSVPLTCRVLFFVLRTHHRQIVASKLMRPLLDRIRGHLRRALQRQKDEMGFNLAALRAISAQVRERGVYHFVDTDGLGADADGDDAEGKKKKRAFVDVA
jgi:U3 small nucleolar RNA-associated protein 12